MKKIFYLLFITFILTQSSFAKQWLIIYAEKVSLDAPVGHAFVSFIQEDLFQKQTKVVGCWGFYPHKKQLKALWGNVPAEMRDDWETHKDYAFLIEVTLKEFEHCLRIKSLYERLSYSLTAQSCVGFVRDIIGAIVRLESPNDNFTFPADVVLELKRLNQHIEDESVRNMTNSIGNLTSAINKNPSDLPNSKVKSSDKQSSSFGIPNKFDWVRISVNTTISLDELKAIKEWDGKSAYEHVMQSIKAGCIVEIAHLDLDGNGELGIITKITGNGCCNWKGECAIKVYEDGGSKGFSLIDDKPEKVIPAKNGIIASNGQFFELVKTYH